MDLDSLLAAEHAARVIWRYVEQLDLARWRTRSRRVSTGRASPASPRLLLALWLYATSQGSAAPACLARLAVSHDAYRWLCGGVSVNHHGLSDFRSGHGELLDRLADDNVAALWPPM